MDGTASRNNLYQTIVDTIATHRVGDRLDRFEPRLVKRRPKRFVYLSKTRNETKRDILTRLKNI